MQHQRRQLHPGQGARRSCLIPRQEILSPCKDLQPASRCGAAPETRPKAAPAPKTIATTAQNARWTFWYTLCMRAPRTQTLWQEFLLGGGQGQAVRAAEVMKLRSAIKILVMHIRHKTHRHRQLPRPRVS